MVAALVALALVGFGVRMLPPDRHSGAQLRANPAAAALPPVVTTVAATPLPETPTSEPEPSPVPEKGPSNSKAAQKKTAEKKTRKVEVPENGPGTFRRVRERVAPATTRGTLKRFDVRVEKGLELDPDQAARLIAEVLNDRRSWRGTGRWRFQLVPVGAYADLHAYIASPGTTDRLCAPLLTRGDVSCQNGNRVVLNAKRWTFGVKYYGDDVVGYRRYLVNHEFGHALGFQHVGCPGRGRPAPVMMQQTKGLGGCRKNPWPRSADD